MPCAAGSVEKLWRWCRRRPVVAGLEAAVVVLMVGEVGTARYAASAAAARAREAEAREREALNREQEQKHRALLEEAPALCFTPHRSPGSPPEIWAGGRGGVVPPLPLSV